MNQFAIKEKVNHGRKGGPNGRGSTEGRHLERDSHPERDPRKEKNKWGITHGKKVVRN